jgi:glycosidase
MLVGAVVRAQDSVDVTFRYNISGFPSGVSVPGEFNGWNNTAWPMSYQGGTLWIRNARLRVGGQVGGGVPGAYQYKFYYNGVTTWPNDPLNHHVNTADPNNNSFIIIKDPTIYQLLPNQRNPLLSTGTPTISAFIFPRVGGSLDSASLALVIDGTTITGLGSSYNATTKQLSYTPTAALPNGNHTVILRAGTNSDTVTFITQAGYVQITTQSGYTTRNPQREIRGLVQNTSVTLVKIVRNNTDTTVASVSNGIYAATITLVEGLNTIKVLADSSGAVAVSSPATFTYFVNHAPNAQITYLDFGSTIQLLATSSTDPDPGQTGTLTFLWSVDPSNPSPIGGVNGSTSPTVTIQRPTVLGEYYFGLVATDINGNKDTTRNYFTLGATPPIITPSYASVPSWVRQGRLYEMFFKSHSPAGTFNGAYADLDRIAAIGYNIIWVMPIMDNNFPINNATGPGYDIVDFYNVAPEYGTNQDFGNFVARAHQLGMKVILDVTPSHSSAGHPFVQDGRLYRENSRYWPYYQHQIIPYSGISIGQFGSPPTHEQTLNSYGYVYYGPFSDELLNYNWGDIDARQYMMDVYKHWVTDYGVDGYRFDVYWGPHIRANSPNGGEDEMGRPVRQYLKHIKPDVYLLGEAMGVGNGTERLYADNSDFRGPGGVESAYDWPLKDVINTTNLWTQSAATRVNTLDQRLRNGSSTAGMGFLPGPNSFFMRFLENHDEDRVIYLFGTGSAATDSMTAMRRTMAMSTAVLMAVGIPMVYSGQEVGRGWGIANFDVRRRGVINWNTWATPTLMPHYQKLAQIRKQFSPFTTQKMVRANTSNPAVYAYTRPSPGFNGIVVTNLDGAPSTVDVTLSAFSSPPNVEGVVDAVPYFASDLYNGVVADTVVFNGGQAMLTLNLPAYGSSVLILDDSVHSVYLPPLTGVEENGKQQLPKEFVLEQNYPNPFNPSTTIRFVVGTYGYTSLRVYDVLGREVATLVDQEMHAGTFTVAWDGRNSSGVPASSGVYFYRLKAGGSVLVKKMLLLK